MKKLECKIHIETSHSREQNITNRDYFLSVTLLVVRGKVISLIVTEETVKGKYRNWIMMKSKNN